MVKQNNLQQVVDACFGRESVDIPRKYGRKYCGILFPNTESSVVCPYAKIPLSYSAKYDEKFLCAYLRECAL